MRTHVIRRVIGYNFANDSLFVQVECRTWGFRLVKDLSVSIAEVSVSDVGVVGQIDIHDAWAALRYTTDVQCISSVTIYNSMFMLRGAGTSPCLVDHEFR